MYIDQKITAFVNKYDVYGADESGQKSNQLALAQQKRIAIKEKVTFYADQSKATAAFSFRAEKALDIHGRYFVEDANGQIIGMFRKQFKQSLLRSTWVIMDRDGNDVFIVQESSEVLAAMRRFGGFIPIVGELVDIIIGFFKYHFQFVDISSSTVVGTYAKLTMFRDHYSFNMTDDAYARVDWRVFAAMGVALDALQSR